MSRFAEGTTVSAAKSRGEIEDLLAKHGAGEFTSSVSAARAWIAFRMSNRLLRFDLPLPDPQDKRFRERKQANRYYPVKLTAEQSKSAYDAEVRRLWRALLLVIKAKLEVVTSGISTFDHEFLAHIVLPGSGTIGEYIAARLDQITAGASLALPEHGES